MSLKDMLPEASTEIYSGCAIIVQTAILDIWIVSCWKDITTEAGRGAVRCNKIFGWGLFLGI
jgi:hypothetical protein